MLMSVKNYPTHKLLPEKLSTMITSRRTLSLFLSIALTCISSSNVQATIISNDQIIQGIQPVSDQQALQASDVRAQLSSMGVTTADLENRIAHMTQAELVQLNQRMAELPAGASAAGVILTVFIVFIVTDVIGATDIFPFVHPVH